MACSLSSAVYEGGLWSNELQCYVYVVSTDPTAAAYDSLWAGRTEGAVLWCGRAYDYCSVTPYNGEIREECVSIFWWQDRIPWREGPTPAELAGTIVASMELRAGQIGLAPPSYTVRPGSQFIVGIPAWLWVDDPGEATTGPMTRSRAEAGVEVSVTATLDRIVYDMGDGGTVTCGPGTEWTLAWGDADSPDCGYTYVDPGEYTITATSYWTANWTGMGQSGSIPVDVTNSVPVRVGEIQVLLTN